MSGRNIDKNRNRKREGTKRENAKSSRSSGRRGSSTSTSTSTLCFSSSWLCRVTLVPFLLWTAVYLFVFRLNPNRSDPFDQPFCDEDGICHERPDAASPRTVYSAWNKEQYDLWWKYIETLEKRVENYAETRQHAYENNQLLHHDHRTRPLILLGDSITESWSGTGLGKPKKRARGVPGVLDSRLSASSGLDPVVLGVSGDQTQHLLYRLEHGHMRAAQLEETATTTTTTTGQPQLFYDPSAIFVVMIGTNNLGSGELPEPTTGGILAVAEHILRETADAGCKVILFGVLPRGDGIPSASLSAIEAVNKGLEKGVGDLAKTYVSSSSNAKKDSPRIRLVDCGSGFLNPDYKPQSGDVEGNYAVRRDLMPDLLHPNAEGHKLLAECIREYIGQIDQ